MANMCAVQGQGYVQNGSMQALYFKAVELAQRLIRRGVDVLVPRAEGMSEHDLQSAYSHLFAKYEKLNEAVTWFDGRTPHLVRKALERARTEQLMVRIFYGDPATGRDFLEEYDVLGAVGRSGGVLKVPLLIPAGECSGLAISSESIVRIIDVRTKKDLYRHPAYNQPKMELRVLTEERVGNHRLVDAGYTHGVWVEERNGQMTNQANFRSFVKAAHWLAFMAGESFDFGD